MLTHYPRADTGRTLCGRLYHPRLPLCDQVDHVTCKVCDRVIAAATPRDSVARVVTRTQGHVAAVHTDLIERLRTDAAYMLSDGERSLRFVKPMQWRTLADLAEDIKCVIKLLEGL